MIHEGRAVSPSGHVAGPDAGVGDVVGGYRIVDVLKVRGCAAIHRAVSADGDTVAVKTVRGGAPSAVVDRFDNEREILRRLDGAAGAPRLLREGEEGDDRFFAVEWRFGESLNALSRRSAGREDRLDAFARSAVPVIRAVARLHARGVAHGDLSRTNILVASPGDVSIIDFDSAVPLERGEVRGLRRKTTWAYAPPEFARGRGGIVPSTAADQYAIAAVLFRQASGKRHRPRAGDDVPRDARSVLDAPVRRAPEWLRRALPGLPVVLERGMDVNPSRRFPSMGDFADAVADVVRRR